MTGFPILNGLIFASLGVALFAVAFYVLSKLAPFDLWNEIGPERNLPVAIFAGAVALGLCWIIAAALH